MSWSNISTYNTTGVRRYYKTGFSGIGGVSLLSGFSIDILTGMINEGYDPSILNNLFAANASDAQMQYLWDNYGAGTPEFAQAANALMISLRGGAGGAASVPGYPLSAQPQPLATGTDFQRSLGLPGGSTGVANVPNPGTLPPGPANPGVISTGGMYLPQPAPPPALNWSQWLQGNAGKILLVIGLIAVVPPLVKKL